VTAIVLHIAPQLALPLDAVTETIGILAVKRAGKSNAAVVLAEEMYAAGLPWVAIDPKGDWWGVRAAGAGSKNDGLQVAVFGGEHGDLPLEPGSGSFVADLIAESRLTCVLDVSEMTKADQRRFLTDFATRLYQKNREPLHVFCEEADEYIPQRVLGENARLVGAFETLVKRGGFRGIGVTLITQRSASLNKDVLTQVGTLIAMRTPSAQDRKAIKAWVDYHDAAAEMVDKLPMLQAGEAYVFSPEWLPRIGMKALYRIRFRRRSTFDSGSTPTVGKARQTPARLADIDLSAIEAQMAETVERAAENDPKALRAKIKALEKQLAARPAETIEVPVEIQVPVISTETLEHLDAILTPHAELLTEITDMLRIFKIGQGAKAPRPAPKPRSAPALPETPPTRVSRPAPTSGNGPGEKLPKMERAILTVLAQFPHDGRTNTQLTTLSGYRYSGGFKNALSALRTAGYITGGNTEVMHATDAGLNALGAYEELPTGPELLEWWIAEQLDGMEKVIIRKMVETQDLPDWTGENLAAACINPGSGEPYAYSGGFKNALSKLRTLHLIEGSNTSGMHLHPDFAEAIT
jgi:hypothetical protein